MDLIVANQKRENLMVEAKLFLRTEISTKDSGKMDICMAMEYIDLRRQAMFIKAISRMEGSKSLEFTSGIIIRTSRTTIRANGNKVFRRASEFNTIGI